MVAMTLNAHAIPLPDGAAPALKAPAEGLFDQPPPA
jgi:4-carboxymuconolactone decarboxylase